jgi:hypothetical protein
VDGSVLIASPGRCATDMESVATLDPRLRVAIPRIHAPFALVSRSHVRSGLVLRHVEHLAAPPRGVQSGGEQAAAWIGSVEDALESPERVTAEILARGTP